MGLKETTERQVEKLNDLYDQHFLIDEEIIKNMVAAAEITKDDKVLEIGPGTGNITRELVKIAKKVIVIEIDEQFKEPLDEIPGNLIVIFGDAIDLLKEGDIRGFNKIVSNLPYQIGEPLMHYLITAKHVKLTVITAPREFIAKMQRNPIFSAFLDIEDIEEIPKGAFYPVPRTRSVIACIRQRPDYDSDKDGKAFIRRELYLQKDKKLKNALREAIISLERSMHGKKITKKESNSITSSIGIDKETLEKEIESLPIDIYQEIADKTDRLIRLNKKIDS